MTKEELKNKCTERAKIFQQAMEGCHSSSPMDCIEWFADRIVELEKKISILLSCKNCPDNKGGLLCQKEYEDKCLAQKIQYIKELQEENKELKEKLKPENCLKLLAKEGYIKFSNDQLTYAKTIIQDLLGNTDEYARQRAEDFLKENK